MIRELLCIIGRHEWDKHRCHNVRDASLGWLAFTPFVIVAIFLGVPKECDRACIHCGKTKTFNHPSHE